MGVFINNQSLESLWKGTRKISIIYRGFRIIWQAIKSCFGAGYWHNNYPWSNDDAWNND